MFLAHAGAITVFELQAVGGVRALNRAMYMRRGAGSCGLNLLIVDKAKNKLRNTPYPCNPRLNKHLPLVV